MQDGNLVIDHKPIIAFRRVGSEEVGPAWSALRDNRPFSQLLPPNFLLDALSLALAPIKVGATLLTRVFRFVHRQLCLGCESLEKTYILTNPPHREVSVPDSFWLSAPRGLPLRSLSQF